MTRPDEALWTPSAEWISAAQITDFQGWLQRSIGRQFADYQELWRWSTVEIEQFWAALAEWYGVRWHQQPSTILIARQMPGAQWFPDGRLNYAEHMLFPPSGIDDVDAPALDFLREDGLEITMSWAELRVRVASVRGWLLRQGVHAGDRVVAFLPNAPHAVVAMLATASIGAIWSSCSPDFGAAGVIDRFAQIEPTVLIAVDGYIYGGKKYDVRATVESLRERLSSLRSMVFVPYLDPDATLDGATGWDDVLAVDGELAFHAMDFMSPLFILYSSGTTGLPKAIVHCHGGVLLEHVKQLGLHLNLGPADRYLWFTTTGWVMWNLVVSALLMGSTIVLYDGSPLYPGPDALWQLAARTRLTCFGVSAGYLQASMKSQLHPARDLDLSVLRTVGSTGSPLPAEGFEWVYAEVGRDLMLSSMSGGTDVGSALLGGVPTLPVRAGEIPCALLACRAEAFDEQGRPMIGQVGELVVTEPMPSMPVMLWNDPDGTRLREAYFDTYPGLWRHGDWVTETSRGSWVVHGRSDATLNRGGVRMGTSEFYRIVEGVVGVVDALVVDTSSPEGAGQLILFVVLDDGVQPDQLIDRIRATIRSQLSPRHVPDRIRVIAEVPRTLSNKKCEVPVKRLLAGEPIDRVVNLASLANPAALQALADFAGSS